MPWQSYKWHQVRRHDLSENMWHLWLLLDFPTLFDFHIVWFLDLDQLPCLTSSQPLKSNCILSMILKLLSSRADHLIAKYKDFFSAFTFFKKYFFKLCMCLYHLSFWNSFHLIFWRLTFLDLPLFSLSSLHLLCLVSFSYGPLLLLPIIRHFQGTSAGPQRCEILDLGPKACLCMYRVGVNGMGLSSSVNRHPRGLSIKNPCIWEKKNLSVWELKQSLFTPH